MAKKKASRHYTFVVTVSFRMQMTFTEKEVHLDSGGDERDFEPTEDALRALERELAGVLGQNYAVSDMEADADSDSLLGLD